MLEKLAVINIGPICFPDYSQVVDQMWTSAASSLKAWNEAFIRLHPPNKDLIEWRNLTPAANWDGALSPPGNVNRQFPGALWCWSSHRSEGCRLNTSREPTLDLNRYPFVCLPSHVFSDTAFKERRNCHCVLIYCTALKMHNYFMFFFWQKQKYLLLNVHMDYLLVNSLPPVFSSWKHHILKLGSAKDNVHFYSNFMKI